MNKFQQYAVGAVRRAANQNPTIAGGNRTITLSATSRPKHSETEQLVERIPPDGSQKSLLLLEKAWGFDFQVIRIRPSFSVPPAPTAPRQSGLRPASFPEGEAFGNPVGLYTRLQALFLNLTGLLWASSPTRFIGLFIEL